MGKIGSFEQRLPFKFDALRFLAITYQVTLVLLPPHQAQIKNSRYTSYQLYANILRKNRLMLLSGSIEASDLTCNDIK